MEAEKNSSLVVTFLASVGAILIFALILWITYLPTHSTEIDGETRAKQEQKLVDLKAEAVQQLQNYAVVNPTDGVYRIPIAQAMELTVEAYQNK